MGQLAGFGTSFLLGAEAPTALSFSMGPDKWAVLGYEATGTAISAWHTGTNISQGRLGWTDTFTLLPLLSVGLSSNGVKSFLSSARAINDRLRNLGNMAVQALNGTSFDELSENLFGSLPTVRPRSIDSVEPAPGQIPLNQKTSTSIQTNVPYIYVVNESNQLVIAVRGSAGRGGIKHTQLTGGGSAKAAGELLFTDDGGILINNLSGRFRVNLLMRLA